MSAVAGTLREKLERRRALVVPGCHDALSARVVEDAGFEAVQISGFGLAGSLLAKPDVGLLDMKEILDKTWRIVRAVRIPVMADIDTGGGNALNAAASIIPPHRFPRILIRFSTEKLTLCAVICDT